MSLAFSGAQRVVAKRDVAACQLGESSVILDLEQSNYFSMNPVAAEIWEKIQDPASVDELVTHVRETFDAADKPVEADVQALLGELLRLKLIDTVDG